MEVNKIMEIVEQEQQDMESMLDRVRIMLDVKRYKEAEKTLSEYVDRFEANQMFHSDEKTEYHSFYEPIEELLYRFLSRSKKKLFNLELPCAQMYQEYGNVLFELGKYEQAREALQKAVTWNPANAQITFDYIETVRRAGDLDEYYKLTREVFHYAIRRDDLARCYRNMAFYLVEKKEYQAAMGCDLMSMEFDSEDRTAGSGIRYIKAATNNTVQKPTQEEMEAYGEKYGFPMGADQIVVGTAWQMANKYMNSKKYDTAIYYLNIVYDLTEDEEVKKKIDTIPNQE